ncbi:hypothetical protein COT40_01740 [Candidatus Peregrinibacteria bacterium CG08_land_8_20_14_0_20_41_10]|nr:MAG: hypothetical protein COT40_01740 [Candidatus Peregrinibacteria bacterium CG08_land_8_20_14_0_20_41_10]
MQRKLFETISIINLSLFLVVSFIFYIKTTQADEIFLPIENNINLKIESNYAVDLDKSSIELPVGIYGPSSEKPIKLAVFYLKTPSFLSLTGASSPLGWTITPNLENGYISASSIQPLIEDQPVFIKFLFNINPNQINSETLKIISDPGDYKQGTYVEQNYLEKYLLQTGEITFTTTNPPPPPPPNSEPTLASFQITDKGLVPTLAVTPTILNLAYYLRLVGVNPSTSIQWSLPTVGEQACANFTEGNQLELISSNTCTSVHPIATTTTNNTNKKYTFEVKIVNQFN